jgi:hypothetical protein
MKVANGVEIQIDFKSLADAKIGADPSITANLKGVSFEQVLSPILKDCQWALQKGPLGGALKAAGVIDG